MLNPLEKLKNACDPKKIDIACLECLILFNMLSH